MGGRVCVGDSGSGYLSRFGPLLRLFLVMTGLEPYLQNWILTRRGGSHPLDRCDKTPSVAFPARSLLEDLRPYHQRNDQVNVKRHQLVTNLNKPHDSANEILAWLELQVLFLLKSHEYWQQLFCVLVRVDKGSPGVEPLPS